MRQSFSGNPKKTFKLRTRRGMFTRILLNFQVGVGRLKIVLEYATMYNCRDLKGAHESYRAPREKVPIVEK